MDFLKITCQPLPPAVPFINQLAGGLSLVLTLSLSLSHYIYISLSLSHSLYIYPLPLSVFVSFSHTLRAESQTGVRDVLRQS